MSTNPADAYALNIKLEREANPSQIDELDEAVIAALPKYTEILSVVPFESSMWCDTARIDAKLKDGKLKSYFTKCEFGEKARRMMEGAFRSEKAYYSYAPEHVPKPLAFGNFKAKPEKWFYLSDFRKMINELPDVEKFVEVVSKVHLSSKGKSPNGWFGFDVATHLANIPNDNTWQDSWEAWFTQAMKVMYGFEKESHGEDEELDTLFDALCSKVIPRLLRPLETDGRSIKPCLIHSDLWPGNVMPDADTGEIMIFDSCAFWGHNEADLGPWRAPRYRLGEPYLEQYKKVMGKSEPEADWDDRNALYALRYDFLLSVLYPNDTQYRQRAREEMRALVEKFPNGLQGNSEETKVGHLDNTTCIEELRLDPE